MWGAWLAQSAEQGTLDLGVMSSGLPLGIELTKKKKRKLKCLNNFDSYKYKFLILSFNSHLKSFAKTS